MNLSVTVGTHKLGNQVVSCKYGIHFRILNNARAHTHVHFVFEKCLYPSVSCDRLASSVVLSYTTGNITTHHVHNDIMYSAYSGNVFY